MGSGGSKAKDAAAAAAAASSSSGGGRGGGAGAGAGAGASGRKGRARGTRVFGSACFGFPSSSSSSDAQFRKGDLNGRSKGIKCMVEVDGKSSGRDREVSQKHKHSPSVTPAFASLDGERIVEDGDGTLVNISGASSSSAATTNTRALSTNPTTRPLSCFGFAPGDVNFRLNRAVSLGSSSARSLFSSGLSINQSDVDGLHLHANFDTSSDANSMRDSGAAATDSSLDLLRDNGRDEVRASRRIHRSQVESENSVMRNSYRRLERQEPLEGSVRFSRTLSVGRLRDRVLRRTPFSEGLFSPSIPDGRSVSSAGQTNARRVLGVTRRGASSSHRIIEPHPDSSGHFSDQIGSSTDNNSDRALETLQPREPSNHDLLDHRSAFLERRRRIRSQVRTLQRLGSRFENLSGHDRSCILSGQHRTGRCTCRTTNRPGTSDDDTSTRASISRIVMLAEALFEVLDEIHQQSVFLSSRPSFSAIGSVPAPKEVVECIPVKVYGKPVKQQNDEAAQCYICLVEYEEGECMRILPCNHEFHLTCIDKWLKEIHRVCPLCRGDVCRSDASTAGKS